MLKFPKRKLTSLAKPKKARKAIAKSRAFTLKKKRTDRKPTLFTGSTISERELTRLRGMSKRIKTPKRKTMPLPKLKRSIPVSKGRKLKPRKGRKVLTKAFGKALKGGARVGKQAIKGLKRKSRARRQYKGKG